MNAHDLSSHGAPAATPGDDDQLRATRLANQALQAFSSGNIDECERLARAILAFAPRHAGANHMLGASYGRRGRLAEAVEFLQAAAGAAPNNGEIHSNLGLAYDRLGDKERAVASYRRAAELKHADPSAHGNLARLLHERGDLDGAVASLQRALEISPNSAMAQESLGQLLRDQGKTREAAIRFRRAAAIQPDYLEAHGNLGIVLRKLGDFAGAIAHSRRAVEIKPDDARTWDVLGRALQETGQFEEAKRAHRRAIEIMPDNAAALVNLGIALQREGHLQAAIAQYDSALAIAPNFYDAKLSKAYALLLSGRLSDGWKLYESRHAPRGKKKPRVELPQVTRPMWEGQDLSGKTLLLATEQGFGDIIQFLRYVPMLAARGAKVDVAVPPSLLELAASVPGVRRVSSMQPGRGSDCDYWSPILSLPLRLGTELDTIPGTVPYLTAPERSVRTWAARIDAVARGRYRVGLAWAGRKTHGNDHHRSLRLDQLTPLLSVKDTCFVSLQKDEPARELWRVQIESDIVDLSDELKSFSDTAGAMMNLDLVISVDTSVAHLAGALARPVWTLLPHAPDWRWLLERDDSPWYPTMRLYRQPKHGDWESAIDKVASDLAQKR